MERAKSVNPLLEGKAAVERWGRLDCAFNNAGIEGDAFVYTADYSEATWDKIVAINLNRRVSIHEIRDPANAEARQRDDHEHVLDRRPDRRCDRLPVYRNQTWRSRTD